MADIVAEQTTKQHTQSLHFCHSAAAIDALCPVAAVVAAVLT